MFVNIKITGEHKQRNNGTNSHHRNEKILSQSPPIVLFVSFVARFLPTV
jgi:hypothetical protein